MVNSWLDNVKFMNFPFSEICCRESYGISWSVISDVIANNSLQEIRLIKRFQEFTSYHIFEQFVN